MKKELKILFTNKNTICSNASKFTQKHSKKALMLGILMYMSTSTMISIASPENSYKAGERILNSSNLPQKDYSSQDIYSLQEQLLEKTRELHEYKARLFRVSHPKDQAKIIELNQKIAAHENNTQILTAKIKEFEGALNNTKKQMSVLKASTEALTDYIQQQRVSNEIEKQELIAKVEALQSDTRLENEQKLNEKLTEDLTGLTNTIAAYEKQINDIKQKHEEDLQDALQDSAILKFELADIRLMTEIKESESIALSLSHLSMALDHANSIKAQLPLHEATLAEKSEQILDLQDRLDYEKQKHVMHIHEFEEQIANNKTDHTNKIQDLQDQIDYEKQKHEIQIQELQESLAKDTQEKLDIQIERFEQIAKDYQEKLESKKEKQELLAKDFQERLNNDKEKHNNQIQAHQDQLAKEEGAKADLLLQKEILLANHEIEKHVLELTLIEKEDELNHHHLNAAQEAVVLHSKIQENIETIENLKQEISRLNANTEALSAKEKELELNIQSLTIVAEHQDHALAEANSAFSMIQEYNFHLESENANLNTRLDTLETAERSLKNKTGEANVEENQTFISPALTLLLRGNSNPWSH